MISEAYFAIIKGIKNFDPDKQKYPNPFAYITKIA
jgi:hypothetical protein